MCPEVGDKGTLVFFVHPINTRSPKFRCKARDASISGGDGGAKCRLINLTRLLTNEDLIRVFIAKRHKAETEPSESWLFLALSPFETRLGHFRRRSMRLRFNGQTRRSKDSPVDHKKPDITRHPLRSP